MKKRPIIIILAIIFQILVLAFPVHAGEEGFYNTQEIQKRFNELIPINSSLKTEENGNNTISITYNREKNGLDIESAWKEALKRSGYLNKATEIEKPKVILSLPEENNNERNGKVLGKYNLNSKIVWAKDYDVLVHEFLHAILHQVEGDKASLDEARVRMIDGIMD